MADIKKVMQGIEVCLRDDECTPCPYYREGNDYFCGIKDILSDTLELLKEQEELLRKLQKDKDKLCLEVSKWKHKFHDAPPNFVSQGVVDQIRWERDTALSQLEQIGKGLGSKMDDIVVLLKEQEAVKPFSDDDGAYWCGSCHEDIVWHQKFCSNCGKPVNWEGR